MAFSNLQICPIAIYLSLSLPLCPLSPDDSGQIKHSSLWRTFLWKSAAERIFKNHGREIRHQPDTILDVCGAIWRVPLKIDEMCWHQAFWFFTHSNMPCWYTLLQAATHADTLQTLARTILIILIQNFSLSHRPFVSLHEECTTSALTRSVAIGSKLWGVKYRCDFKGCWT